MPKEEDLPDFTEEEAKMPKEEDLPKEEWEEEWFNSRHREPHDVMARLANECQTPGCTISLKDHTIGQAHNHFNVLSQQQAKSLFGY